MSSRVRKVSAFRIHPAVRALLPVVVLAAVVGCEPPPDERLKTLHQRADAVSVDNDRLQRQVLERDAEVADLKEQIATLQSLGPERLNKLFTAERIRLVSLTGGADYDGIPGDDGITVYLQPLDADGHVLKAAGEIIVELLDTSVPGAPRSLGRYIHNDTEQLRALWHGDFLTDHYTIKCPWSPGLGPPRTRDVLIKVTFYDFLTGKRLTASEQVEVTLRTASVDGR